MTDLEFVELTKELHLDVCAYSLAAAYLNSSDTFKVYQGEMLTQELKIELLRLITTEGERIQDKLKQMRENLKP